MRTAAILILWGLVLVAVLGSAVDGEWARIVFGVVCTTVTITAWAVWHRSRSVHRASP